MGSKAKKSTALAAAATGLINEATGKKPKRKRRGRKLFLLGVIGLGAAAFKATRSSAPEPVRPQEPAPAPAPKAVADPTPPPPLPDEPALPDTTALDNAVAPEDTADATQPLATAPAPEVLAEPVLETTELHDIVEEPWAADAEVTPAEEPPADSLTSFFDEVMTDTAERKLRKGR